MVNLRCSACLAGTILLNGVGSKHPATYSSRVPNDSLIKEVHIESNAYFRAIQTAVSFINVRRNPMLYQ